MQRFIAFSFTFIASVGSLWGCSLTSSLTGGFGTGSPASSGSPVDPTINRPMEPAAGMSEYATRFVRNTNELKVDCPIGPSAPPDYQSKCKFRAQAAANLWTSVDEKSTVQVTQGKAYLDQLAQSFTQWDAGAAAAEDHKQQDYHRDHDVELAAFHAEDLIKHLTAARAGKIDSTLISSDNRDAGYVKQRLDMLRAKLPELETIAKGCARGGGSKDLCDLATHRDAYFAKMMSLQFDAIIAERIKGFTGVVDRVNDNESIAVINYNTIMDHKYLGELGDDLDAIGKVLEQKQTRAAINAKLDKLRSTFVAAVKAKSSTNAWAAHAAAETHYQDPAVTRAVRSIQGLSLVRVGVKDAAWDVIRGPYDQPVQRNKYVWALLRKAGDAFCRLYPFTVTEDHVGGGRYSEARVITDDTPEFYVSACK
jgi:hypothetical protein